MTIEEFTLYTGYVPESEDEFASIERDKKVFNAPTKEFCDAWINTYYVAKVIQANQKIRELTYELRNSAEMYMLIKCKIDRIWIMIGNMRYAYMQTLSA